MAAGIHRLTRIEVQYARTPGRLHDGGGLYLQVLAARDGAVTKSWLLLFTSPLTKKRREMGFGSADVVALADARDRAEEARRLVAADIDPIEARKTKRAAAQEAAARAMTFREAAEAYLAAHRDQWRNAKHAAQWSSTLETYAYPEIGSLAVSAIDVAAVLRVLEPIWRSKTETAARVRGRIEAILDWASVRGARSGDNPARWRGHLQKALPARTKTTPVVHHPALPFVDLPAFVRDLRSEGGLAAKALELAVLTAARSNEVLGAKWSELDLDKAVWTVPADRMKSEREHRVPLSKPAVALLRGLKRSHARGWVFPGAAKGKPLSNMAMSMVLRRMKRDDITVHGFRSSFRDWAAESTNFPREVAEAALAHVLGDRVEAAYRRGDLFEKRRKLMQAWADFAEKRPAKTVQIQDSKTAGAESGEAR